MTNPNRGQSYALRTHAASAGGKNMATWQPSYREILGEAENFPGHMSKHREEKREMGNTETRNKNKRGTGNV